MPCIASPACPDPRNWRQQFVGMLPDIKTHAGAAFEHLAPEQRPLAVREVVVQAFCAMATLARTGKTGIASPATLARYGVNQVNDPRRQK